MKKALAVVAQIVLFFLVFAIFSFAPPFGMHWMVRQLSPTVTRYFVADGFALTTALLALILLVEAVSKRLPRFGLLTALAYGIAVLIGFLLKLGFKTHDALS